jgi:hypothetical protein
MRRTKEDTDDAVPIQLIREEGLNGARIVSGDSCGDDVGRLAAETLANRVAQHGGAADAPWIARWIAGQDQVYASCSEAGLALPEAAPADAPLWYRQDRAYQRAAALFHDIRSADRQIEARAAFLAIAGDKASPWAPLARYLVARCDLRTATLSDSDAVRGPALQRAEEEFRGVAADPRSPWRQSAQGLLHRVAVERDRYGTMMALAHALERDTWDADAQREVGDFLLLVRTTIEARTGTLNGWQGYRSSSPGESELVDWMAAMGAVGAIDLNEEPPVNPPGPEVQATLAREHARVCALAAQGAHRDAWAIACYVPARTLADVPPALHARVIALPPASPAWATLTVLDLRLQVRALVAAGGTPAAAAALRSRIDAVLARGDGVLGLDGSNLLRATRAWVSRDAADLLAGSLVRPLDDPPRYAWNTEHAREPSRDPEGRERPRELAPGVRDLATASVPLSSWVAVANAPSSALDPELRRIVQRVAFTRAALLGRDDLARTLAPAVAKDLAAVPDGARLEPWLAATDPVQRRFELARLLQRAVLSPTFDGMPDGASGGGWGCGFPEKGRALPFLTAEERAAAASERAALARLGTTTTFIGQATVAWARQHPADPRLPAALQEVVEATRNGCSGETPISRAAFVTLKKLYPKSEEARSTRYYY